MIRKTTMMTSIAILLLIPIAAMAQTTPGEDEFVEYGAVGVTDELAVLDSVLDDYLIELET